MVTEKKILGDGFTEIETTPSLDAELFPEFTSNQFKVSKEKKDELFCLLVEKKQKNQDNKKGA